MPAFVLLLGLLLVRGRLFKPPPSLRHREATLIQRPIVSTALPHFSADEPTSAADTHTVDADAGTQHLDAITSPFFFFFFGPVGASC